VVHVSDVQKPSVDQLDGQGSQEAVRKKVPRTSGCSLPEVSTTFVVQKLPSVPNEA
jgi:hypothetical protein